MSKRTTAKADVCLILEGTYPYISGGVSSWTHELIKRQEHLTFHIAAILPRDARTEPVYTLPKNVVGITNIHLQELPEGSFTDQSYRRSVYPQLRAPLEALMENGHLDDFRRLHALIAPHAKNLGQRVLLDSRDTFKLLVKMYEDSFRESSFLDYFWSWRAIMGSLYSLLLAELPDAKLYHSLSTGYGGMLGARAKMETGRPLLLTEHGIYTNERRIEIASADWLEETTSHTLTIDKTRLNLRDLWMNAFASYSRVCYEAADRIVTLYEGNQETQSTDGADAQKMQIISNGVDVERFGKVTPTAKSNPAIALIGRVVPIKDIKTFIRAASIIRNRLPDLKAYVIGPADEDPEYYVECLNMVEHLGLQDTVEFTGKVLIDDYLKQIDLLVLTSISEAQPLAILEAAACGIPTVATNVGACREMLVGKSDESPYLGASGIVTALSNPAATANAVLQLLTDRDLYERCGTAARERVTHYYNKNDQHASYRALYSEYLG